MFNATYSHEVGSCGFLPAAGATVYPAYYSPHVPETEGFAKGAYQSTAFAALALGLILYGVALTTAITSVAWFGRERTINARG